MKEKANPSVIRKSVSSSLHSGILPLFNPLAHLPAHLADGYSYICISTRPSICPPDPPSAKPFIFPSLVRSSTFSSCIRWTVRPPIRLSTYPADRWSVRPSTHQPPHGRPPVRRTDRQPMRPSARITTSHLIILPLSICLSVGPLVPPTIFLCPFVLMPFPCRARVSRCRSGGRAAIVLLPALLLRCHGGGDRDGASTHL